MTSFLTLTNIRSDGFGSIMEYILGAVYFCNRYGLEYIHTDLTKLEHNDIPIVDWLQIWNYNIQNIFLPNVKNSIEFKGNIQDIHQLSFIPSPNTLFRLDNTSWLKHIFDQENKELRNKIVGNFVEKTKDHIKDFKSDVINIAVHIRRFMKTDCDNASWRELYEKGNDVDTYFQNIINNLLKILPNAFVHIYSQGDKNLFSHYLDISPNICIYTENSLIHDLVHLSFADILVMSKGSYSRIANYYSNGIKLIRESSTPSLTDKTLYISSGKLTDDQEQFILKNTVCYPKLQTNNQNLHKYI